MAAATVAAQRGHRVTLFEASGEIGGQYLEPPAKRIPGKEEFHETLRYFGRRLEQTGVDVRLGTHAEADTLAGFDAVVLATGIRPREVDFPGADHAKVVSYLDVLRGRVVAGRKVAMVGAGGIGFDVAEFLVEHGASASLDAERWRREWGVDLAYDGNRGGLATPEPEAPAREVWLLQRSPGRPGARLGQTTGWIHHSATLKARRVRMLGGVGDRWASTTRACTCAWTAVNRPCRSTTWSSAQDRSRSSRWPSNWKAGGFRCT